MSIEIVRSAVAAVSPMLQAMEQRIIARLELLEQRGAAAIGRIGSQPVQPVQPDEDEDEDEDELESELAAAREQYEETNQAAINAAALADDLNAKLQAARAARYARLNRR